MKKIYYKDIRQLPGFDKLSVIYNGEKIQDEMLRDRQKELDKLIVIGLSTALIDLQYITFLELGDND